MVMLLCRVVAALVAASQVIFGAPLRWVVSEALQWV